MCGAVGSAAAPAASCRNWRRFMGGASRSLILMFVVQIPSDSHPSSPLPLWKRVYCPLLCKKPNIYAVFRETDLPGNQLWVGSGQGRDGGPDATPHRGGYT